ncbi:MAG: sulfate permease [Verrucomicrobia bacterium]|nr:sulfate permease [Verrucomicrobiota bacterium]
MLFKKYQEFIPKSYLLLRKYQKEFFKKDLLAGITVGLVSVPLAMALAIASGVDPERGLFTAIIGGFLVALLGGSRVQISGPTGAFVVVVYATVQRHGYEGLVLATFLAALMLIAMGLFRLGSLIKFIPIPLTTGFTAGIGVVLFSSQIKDFFGLQTGLVPADFIPKWKVYFSAMPSLDPLTLFFGLGVLLFIVFLRRFFPSFPWAIGTIILATLAASFLKLPIETIASRFGEIPRTLPSPSFSLDWSRIFDVFPDAVTIALLAAIESLLCAVIADGMMGTRHKSNCELVAQGIGNLGSMAFGGIPVTAAIARTATNVKSGAQTPLAGMIHAVTVFLVILLFAPFVGAIPLAAMAAILMVVAWNMSHFPFFFHLLKAPKGDVAILLTSFFLTVLVDITVAVEVGMILAAFFFLKRMSENRQQLINSHRDTEKGIEVIEMRGPLFFGVADKLKDAFQSLPHRPKFFVLKMEHVSILDATGLHVLRELEQKCLKEEARLLLTEVQEEPAKLLHDFGLGHLIQRKEDSLP